MVLVILTATLRAEPPARLPAPASEPSGSLAGDELPGSAPTRARRRQEVRNRIVRIKSALSQNRGNKYLLQELELLKWIDSIYSSHRTTNEQLRELQQDSQHLEEDSQLRSQGVQQVSFVELDDLRDRLLIERSRIESIDLEIDAIRAGLEVARDNKDDADARRRLTRDSIEKERNVAKRERLRREYAMARLTSQAYELIVEQQRLELKVKDLELTVSRRQQEVFEQRVRQLRETARFSQADLQKKIEQINSLEATLQRRVATSQGNLQVAERRWSEAKQAHDMATSADPVLTEQLEAWRQARELRHDALVFLKQAVALAGHSRNIWRLRYQLVNGLGEESEFMQWQNQVATRREEVERFQRLLRIRANEVFGDSATVRKRLFNGSQEVAGAIPWIEHQAKELDHVISHYVSMTVMTKAVDRMLQRFEEDLQLKVHPTSARETFARALHFLRMARDYEITAVDDRPITVGKVGYGILLFVSGFIIARTLSRTVGRRVLPRFGLTQGASQAFQSIAFYLMLTIFGYLALEIINVPLTVFAFMGGAVAIGAGFGSQNILNNFISGLIVLAERPIRVGDLVEIGELTGTIERIGARSTRVKTGANLEIIVPNSTFLENNVTNWTLSDTRIRTMLSVGVAYGSPTKEVSRLLRLAVTEHQDVLDSPGAIVLFKEFGDNSLVFEVHFWLNMRTMMQAEKVASDVRHHVDELLAAADIVIAYPQRDVHLDSLAPIEVSVRHHSGETDLQLMPRDAA